ncbi:MAG: hypothetical protein DRJ98_07090 [Thermoprotei archaeon]|nr:MAG: hypothetical protein DRJ98_07090 [Thermoprotei archaeon]
MPDILYEALKDYIRNLGFHVEEEVEIPGSSGYIHKVELVAEKEGKQIAIRYFDELTLSEALKTLIVRLDLRLPLLVIYRKPEDEVVEILNEAGVTAISLYELEDYADILFKMAGSSPPTGRSISVEGESEHRNSTAH